MEDNVFDFGVHLKALRTECNLSQKILARLIGMSPSSISKFENNTQEPDHEKLKKLASVFKVTVDYLIGYSSDDVIVLDGVPDKTKLLIREMIASVTKYEGLKNNPVL